MESLLLDEYSRQHSKCIISNNSIKLTVCRSQPQLIQQRGFRAENHTVVTPDGYVLQIYRIVNPNRSANSTHFGYPIILLSGFLLASEGYLDNADAFLLPQNGLYTEFENNFQNRLQFNCLPNVRPERSGRSLPYTLAACGYDVWLPNLRDAFGYASHLVLSQSRGTFFACA